jgi:hypothetical protein
MVTVTGAGIPELVLVTNKNENWQTETLLEIILQ